MVNLKPRHTLALDAHCNNLYTVRSIEEFSHLNLDLDRCLILGGGSNVAFVEDYDGDILTYQDESVKIIDQPGYWLVEAGAGLVWHDLVVRCVKRGIGGLENLALIPGSCGAAAVQNIGAYGVEFKDVCYAVESYDVKTGAQKRYQNHECRFDYRNSLFKQSQNRHLLITRIILRLDKNWCPVQKYNGLEDINGELTPLTLMQRVIELRQSKLPDPNILPNAGSFFKNPIVSRQQANGLKQQYPSMPVYEIDEHYSKLSSGWLIENAGLKGKQMDGIGTYEKHALVIINYGSGSGRALLRLVHEIRDRVYSLFSVKLENEVLLIGKQGVIKL
ncbi:UDP-N-acetylmuramate dehydrogenase [Planctobacterium marinum]|uniref:UDP-N-acetylenolpyruvoylglucosamine reductase n=1 Tax=Planctobacterium marinum TaxID=1631968 RepID=A0AA48HMA8_9ALTE|nr:UDP-N-acetylenolpyruvoylglucosamine reductase [Planctobacterium marinum]